MAHSVEKYASLPKPTRLQRLQNLEIVLEMYISRYEELSNGMRNFEAGEERLRQYRTRLSKYEAQMHKVVADWDWTNYTMQQLERVLLFYKPLVSACTLQAEVLKRAMSDHEYGKKVLAEIQEKLEDLHLDIINVSIALEM